MKRLLMLVLAILLCLAFVGCNKRTSEGLDEFEQLLNEEESESETAFAERVYIIIPQSCSAELSAKAQVISEKITEKTGVPVSVKYDNEETVSQGNNLEILVGDTNRLHSKEVIEPLRVGEYVCCWDRGVIIVGGRYEESTLEAMDEFIEKVLPGASYASLMGENVNLNKTVEYEIERLTINGYDLYDFTIMYCSENKNHEKDIAIFFRDYLAKQSGYLLDVISSSDRSKSTGKVIAIGNALGENENWEEYDALIKTLEGNDILVGGNGSYGISAAVAELVNKISLGVKDENKNVELSSPTILKTENASVKICNAFVSGDQDNEQTHDFTQKIRDGEYDIVIFSSVSKYISQNIDFNKGSYKYYTVDLKDGNTFVALYNSETIKDVLYDGSTSQSNVSFVSAADGKNYRVALNASEGDVSNVYDVLAVDTPTSETHKNIEGFKFVGEQVVDGQASKKSFYIGNNFASDGVFETVSNINSDWANIFCSVNMKALLCDEYVALTNAVG